MDRVLPLSETREIVASYPSRASFEGAVTALLAAGFDRTDLSVLGTHDSLAAAGRIAGYDPEPGARIEAGIAGEIGLLSSFTVAGVLLVMTGPVGIAAAALAGAAAGALAFRPFFDQLTESRHAASFADAVSAGRILLWVRTPDAGRAETAEKLLTETGGSMPVRLAKPAREAN
jgi:hypothetical protein